MDFLLIILVTAVLAFLLHRDDRLHRAGDVLLGDARDRDVERVRADLLAGADALARQPLRRAMPSSSDWEPRA
ncbi:hypothetical protein [Pseudactinotalea suaedae]|jgi:hypothetical protein|uniref:hypothetical protein n=1 Tax=Pseudactinotalea suaedae TaxID=1524924 RepID=UPI0012E1248A|nr:hypothetical protein [Pseudactinotalea suaedae]